MIFVNRKGVKKPKILTGKYSPGEQEKLDNIDFIESDIGDKLKFNVYNHDEVKEKLLELFNEKCAYCEREITDVTYGSIDHFRPKAEIIDINGTKLGRGYYWLASDWDNLLLLCNNCNSEHYIKDTSGIKIKYGKGNYFPLLPGTKHSERKQGIKREENKRLLINPTVENPNDYLEFDVKTGTVSPKNTNLLVNERGKKTIEIFGLDKRVCTQKREKAALNFWNDINEIIAAAELLDAIDVTNHNAKTKALETLKKHILNIETFIKNEKTENLGFLKLAMNEAKATIDLYRP